MQKTDELPYRRAYVGGTFDILHPGHINFFAKVKAFIAKVLVVGLNTDEFAAQYKRKPIMTYDERYQMLNQCKFVDYIMKNIGDADSRPSIKQSGADVVVHGSDWERRSLLAQMMLDEQWLLDNGIKLEYVQYSEGMSTTEIINRCKRVK